MIIEFGICVYGGFCVDEFDEYMNCFFFGEIFFFDFKDENSNYVVKFFVVFGDVVFECIDDFVCEYDVMK